MPGQGESATSLRRIHAVDRQRQALAFRAAGATYAGIAQALGYRGPSGAEKAIKTAMLATIEEPASVVRLLELERLDALQMGLWGKAKGGDLLAVDRVLKIMERRARLLGLDAPVREDVTSHIRVGSALATLSDEQLRRIAGINDPPLALPAP